MEDEIANQLLHLPSDPQETKRINTVHRPLNILPPACMFGPSPVTDSVKAFPPMPPTPSTIGRPRPQNTTSTTPSLPSYADVSKRGDEHIRTHAVRLSSAASTIYVDFPKFGYFLDLPAELRERVYEIVIEDCCAANPRLENIATLPRPLFNYGDYQDEDDEEDCWGVGDYGLPLIRPRDDRLPDICVAIPEAMPALIRRFKWKLQNCQNCVQLNDYLKRIHRGLDSVRENTLDKLFCSTLAINSG